MHTFHVFIKGASKKHRQATNPLFHIYKTVTILVKCLEYYVQIHNIQCRFVRSYRNKKFNMFTSNFLQNATNIKKVNEQRYTKKQKYSYNICKITTFS